MGSGNESDWPAFYEELADKLLQYKNNRQELVENVRKIYMTAGIKLPKLLCDNKIVDIDPFTFFGFFNRKETKEPDRKRLFSAVADCFSVGAPVPTLFKSIVRLPSINAVFYPLQERDDGDIDDLWTLFEVALAYATNPTPDNRTKLSKYFDLCINKKGNGTKKIAMGMSWIAPNSFLPLSEPTIKYIYDSGKLPADVVQKLPTLKSKIPSATYLDIVKTISDYLQSGSSSLGDLKDLNYEAWLDHKREVRSTNDFVEESPIAISEINTIDDVEGQEKYPAYDAEKFLE